MSDPKYEYKTTSLWLEAIPGTREAFDTAVARITTKHVADGWRTVSVITYLGDVVFVLEREIPQNPFDRVDSWHNWLAWETEHHPDENPYDHKTQRARWHEWNDEKIRREASA